MANEQQQNIKDFLYKIGLDYDKGRINQMGQLVISIDGDEESRDSASDKFGKVLDKVDSLSDDSFWKFEENSTLTADGANLLYQYEDADAQFNFIADFVADTYTLIITMFKETDEDGEEYEEELPEDFKWYDFED